MMRSTLLAAVLSAGLPAGVLAQAHQGAKARPSPSPLAAPASTAAPSSPSASDDELAIYAVGYSIWRSLASLDLSPAEVEILKRGLNDAVAGKPAVPLNESAPRVEALRRARAQRAVTKEKDAAAAFLDKAGKEPGSVKTPSGLVFVDVRPGTGPSPQATDTVKVHYRGTLLDGTEFDSSLKRAQPVQFSLKSVIPCWTEGLQKMKVGGKARLVCPSTIAYGDRGQSSRDPRRPSIPGGAALLFEVELFDIVSAAAPSPARPSPGSPR